MQSRNPSLAAVLTAVAVAVLVPSAASAEEPPEPPPRGGVDATVQPFAWQELYRGDYRAASPVTRETYLVNAAVPLPELPVGGAFVFTYRTDEFASGLSGGLGAFSGQHVHAFDTGVPLALRVGERWALNFDPRLLYGSDFDDPSAGGFGYSLRAGATWEPIDDLAVSLAVLYGTTFDFPVPVLGIYWRPQDLPIRIDGLLPRYAEVAVDVSSKVRWFGMFNFEGQRWVARDRRDGQDGRVDLRRTEIRLSSGVRWRFFGPVGVELAAQWVPWQQLRVVDGPGVSASSFGDVSATLGLGVSTADL